jgi:hypothetical protein
MLRDQQSEKSERRLRLLVAQMREIGAFGGVWGIGRDGAEFPGLSYSLALHPPSSGGHCHEQVLLAS